MMTDEEPVAVDVEVELPRELLYEMDQFAAQHGYENPSAVVRRALDAREE